MFQNLPNFYNAVSLFLKNSISALIAGIIGVGAPSLIIFIQ
jgi:hypothetical protein